MAFAPSQASARSIRYVTGMPLTSAVIVAPAVGWIGATGAGHGVLHGVLGGHFVHGGGKGVRDVTGYRQSPLQRVVLGQIGNGAAEVCHRLAEHLRDALIGGDGALIPSKGTFDGPRVACSLNGGCVIDGRCGGGASTSAVSVTG